MIRLGVRGADDMLSAIEPRLRGGVLSAADGDALVFAAPSAADVSQIEQALAAGKHILLTAEAWLTPEMLVPLSAAANKAGAQLAVVNPDRFLPSRQLVRQEVAAGKLGEPGLVRIHRWEAAGAQSDDLGSIPTPLLRDLDLALWLIGKEPNVVYAVEHPATGKGVSGRYIQLHLGFPGDAMALIDYSSRLPAGEGYQSLHVIGSAGAAYADDQQNMQLVYQGGQPRGVLAPEKQKQLGSLLQDFLDGLAAKRNFSPTIAAWQSVLAVADAARRSLKSRQAISAGGG